MTGNLITRLGTASGVVAAIIATCFALLVQTAHDIDRATSRARTADRVLVTGSRAAVTQSQLRAAARGNGRLSAEVGTIGGTVEPAELAALRRDAQDESSRQRAKADDAVHRAVVISVGGVIGSTVLIFLMTSYLTRSIVVPLRRVASAAVNMAEGDLSVRVVEEGDAEPVELARSFNEMAANLQAAQAQLQGETQVKDEFFALVSHELRTPLTSIMGYLELVRDDEDELPADTRRFLEVVDRNAQRLLRLVGDMLFVAQVEAGRLSLERSSVDLRTVAQDAVEAARPAAARGRVTLELDAAPGPPITGDRDRLGQMIDNLISNALKFTPEGRAVRVSLRDDGRDAVLEVGDEGVGIPEADQEHLFERFFRASTAVSKAVPGAGLGLTIVKTIVEAHGGSIALTSTEGIGTTVRVTLPHVFAADGAVA